MHRHGRTRAALSLLGHRPLATLVEWGCGEGEFAESVALATDVDVLACDVDADYVAALESRAPRNLTALHLDDLLPRIPRGESTVDVVTCLDVLEHMGDASRPAALAEMHRVLRPDGRLIITVPHRGILHWADPENVKFRAPRLHRAVYRLARGSAAYERTYGRASRFGNYAVDGRWHHHFTRDELIDMLAAWFRPDATLYFGLVHPVVRYLMYAHELVVRRLGRSGGGGISRMLWALYIWDADLVTGRWAYNLGMSFVPRTQPAAARER